MHTRSLHNWPLLPALPLVALAFLLLPPAPAQAQMEHSTAQARTTQYVVVIDDSGSMRVRTSDGPAADPDRLAIFAVQSLLSLLDDRDEVTIVRLNGPADGESITPIAPLAENRSTLEAMLALDGPIAAYPGRRTPCVAALNGLQDELNQSYRPNVNQVVLFLTDGECNDGLLNTERYLSGVDSHADDLFQLYLLRWQGRPYAQYLVDLARQTGGSVALVSADDPTDLIGPFASMLSRSQGHEAYRLSPRDRVIPAHEGARRVRLLAVAPDQGTDLEIQVSSTGGGDPPERLGQTRTGLHQYEDGARYRYAALDLRPGTSSVSLSVTGGGDDWAIVALPEYRLFVRSTLRDGRCNEEGPEVSFVEVGGGLCLSMELVNEDGQQVTSDVAGRGIEADVLYQSPTDDEPRVLPANQVGDAPHFRLERVNLTEGDHVFVPRITLRGAQGEAATIRGASRSLQVSTRRVSADPARLELGDLLPGSEHYHEVTIDGNFPSTRARLQVEGRENLPECLRFALNGVPEGDGQTISAGQQYTVEVHVDPYCGPTTTEVNLDTALRLQFDRSTQSAPIPSLVLPIRGDLISELRAPTEIDVSVRAGRTADVRVPIGGNQRRTMEFTALVPPERDRAGWPRRHIDLVLLDDEGNAAEVARDGSIALPVRIPASEEDATSVFSVQADTNACCNGGSYTTELVLVPSGGAQTPLRIPIVVDVEEARLWQCWGPTILRTLLALLILLLLAYLFNMWRSSHFLDRDRLADRIVPVYWSDYGETRPHTRSAADVRQMVRRSMKFTDRARAWLKANPLVFGLPGREYDETVELILDGSRNVQRSRIRLIEERDFIAEIRQNPRAGIAKIYATARGGMTFYAVPGEGDRIATFRLQRDFEDFGDEDFEPKLEPLRRRAELLSMHSDQEPDTMAGWRVG